jgi:hypothetical protein
VRNLVGYSRVLFFFISIFSISFTVNAQYIADFETGYFTGNGKARDGGNITALAHPRRGDGVDACTGSASKQRLYTPGSSYDIRVETDVDIKGSVIRPRKGRYFMYQEIFADNHRTYPTDYSSPKCTNRTSSNNKPRVSLSVKHPNYKPSMAWGEEVWIGYSVFIPKNLEAENCGGDNLDFRTTSLGEFGTKLACSSCNIFKFGLATAKDGDRNPTFYFETWTDETSDRRTSRTKNRYYFLGNNAQGLYDRGKWTDFVIRWVNNPFTKRTTHNGKTYEANRGVFQVWKQVGPDRKLTKVLDITNVPFGLRPPTESTNGNNIGAVGDFRMYKYAWNRSCKSTTTVSSRHYSVGWDEIRIGTRKQGISCAAVNPNGTSCSGTTSSPSTDTDSGSDSTGDIASIGDATVDGKPSVYRSKETGLFIWRSDDGGLHVGASSGSKSRTFTGKIYSTESMSSLYRYKVESSDSVSFSNNKKTINFTLKVSSSDVWDTFGFKAPASAQLVLDTGTSLQLVKFGSSKKSPPGLPVIFQRGR